jgi:hypothetical protein
LDVRLEKIRDETKKLNSGVSKECVDAIVPNTPVELLEIQQQIILVMEANYSMDLKLDWTGCIAKFQKIVYMMSRHIIRNYLYHKKPNVLQSELKASEMEINYQNPDFCELVKNVYHKFDNTQEKIELSKIEDKMENVMAKQANYVSLEDVKNLVKFYVKKENEKMTNELETVKSKLEKVLSKNNTKNLIKTSSRKNSDSETEFDDELKIDTEHSDTESENEQITNEEIDCNIEINHYPVEFLPDLETFHKNRDSIIHKNDMENIRGDLWRACGPNTTEYLLTYEKLWDEKITTSEFKKVIKCLLPTLITENPIKRVKQDGEFRNILGLMSELLNLLSFPNFINMSTLYRIMTTLALKIYDVMGDDSRVYQNLKHQIKKLKPDLLNNEAIEIVQKFVPAENSSRSLKMYNEADYSQPKRFKNWKMVKISKNIPNQCREFAYEKNPLVSEVAVNYFWYTKLGDKSPPDESQDTYRGKTNSRVMKRTSSGNQRKISPRESKIQKRH